MSQGGDQDVTLHLDAGCGGKGHVSFKKQILLLNGTASRSKPVAPRRPFFKNLFRNVRKVSDGDRFVSAGLLAESTETPPQVGVIELDIVNNQIPPLPVRIADGSAGQDFRSMGGLGIRYIADGTDHLLFLLVLPASLVGRSDNSDGAGSAGCGTSFDVCCSSSPRSPWATP